MGDPLRAALAVLLLVAGVALSATPATCSTALCQRQHTLPRSSKRAALAVLGVALIVLGSRLVG